MSVLGSMRVLVLRACLCSVIGLSAQASVAHEWKIAGVNVEARVALLRDDCLVSRCSATTVLSCAALEILLT
jgi:hypothetical protein